VAVPLAEGTPEAVPLVDAVPLVLPVAVPVPLVEGAPEVVPLPVPVRVPVPLAEGAPEEVPLADAAPLALPVAVLVAVDVPAVLLLPALDCEGGAEREALPAAVRVGESHVAVAEASDVGLGLLESEEEAVVVPKVPTRTTLNVCLMLMPSQLQPPTGSIRTSMLAPAGRGAARVAATVTAAPATQGSAPTATLTKVVAPALGSAPSARRDTTTPSPHEHEEATAMLTVEPGGSGAGSVCSSEGMQSPKEGVEQAVGEFVIKLASDKLQ
jgi:hypothetical protein